MTTTPISTGTPPPASTATPRTSRVRSVVSGSQFIVFITALLAIPAIYWLGVHGIFQNTFGWRLLLWALLMAIAVSLFYRGNWIIALIITVIGTLFVLLFGGFMNLLGDFFGNFDAGGLVSIAFAIFIVLAGIGIVIGSIALLRLSPRTTP